MARVVAQNRWRRVVALAMMGGNQAPLAVCQQPSLPVGSCSCRWRKTDRETMAGEEVLRKERLAFQALCSCSVVVNRRRREHLADNVSSRVLVSGNTCRWHARACPTRRKPGARRQRQKKNVPPENPMPGEEEGGRPQRAV